MKKVLVARKSSAFEKFAWNATSCDFLDSSVEVWESALVFLVFYLVLVSELVLFLFFLVGRF